MFEFETYWDNSEATPATQEYPAFPMTIAACYVSTKVQWDEFSKNWRKALDDEGLDFFHMTDFMASRERGVKPYCEWDQPKRDRFYYRLANIINTRIRTGFVFALPTESFDLHTPEHFKRDLGKRHFTFAVRTVLDLVSQWYAGYGSAKGVQYVFDRMGKGSGEITAIFDIAKERPEWAAKLGVLPNEADGITFQNKEHFRPLQAADILAWNMRSFMQGEISRGLPEIPGKVRPYFEVLRKPPMRIGFMRDRDLEKAAHDISEYEEREGKPAYTMTRRQLKEWRKREE
jgi:hypothetical protein